MATSQEFKEEFLPEQTGKLWNFLQHHPALQGFVLIGGTALALQIGHRLSEDLDFAYNAVRLPPMRVDALMRALEVAGFHWQPNDDIVAVQQFELAGMELGEFQRNILINGIVKLTFVAPEEPTRNVLDPALDGKLRVATLDELFSTKALVTAVRSKSRDWFDLYILMKNYGYTMRDFKKAFDRSGRPAQFDYAVRRLLTCKKDGNDEGYEQMLGNPPSLDHMRDFFTSAVSEYEIEAAAQELGDAGRLAP